MDENVLDHIHFTWTQKIYVVFEYNITFTMAYYGIFQFSSVAQSCLTLCDPFDCSVPVLPVHHRLLEFAQTCPLSQWRHPTISSSVIPFSSWLHSFPASGSFQTILVVSYSHSDGFKEQKECGKKICIFFRIIWKTHVLSTIQSQNNCCLSY